MPYSHLGLREWPFRIVPEPEFCDFIADRLVLRKDVDALFASLAARPTSDIQLIWSWLGAGKTHTLYYLANQCTQQHQLLLPIYAELPRESKGFVDLYRTTIAQIPIGRLIDAFLEQMTRPTTGQGFHRALDPDLHSALKQAAVGDKPIENLLNQWLLGNSLAPASHRQLGVGGRINTVEKCVTVLAGVISLIAPKDQTGQGDSAFLKRIVWIVDEAQRVEDQSPTVQRSILSGLVGVFNRCPTGLTILLSYTGAPKEKSLPKWIPPDLADRIGLERPMLLPPLGMDEADLFVRDLLSHFRLPGSHFDQYHPFEKDAITELLKALVRKGDLKPRALMEALDASLRHCEPHIRAGTIKSVGIGALKESLAKFSLQWSTGTKKK
jgi:hypothetical protein